MDNGTPKTNFVTTQDGNLIFKHDDKDVQTWSSTPSDQAGGNIDFKTKEFDFGDPSRLKKIYKVYITYKCEDAPVMKVYFFKNGDTSTAYAFSASTSTYYSGSVLADTNNAWVNASLVPNVLSQASGIYTFGLYFDNTGTTDATFEIDDISIVFRMHNAK